MAGLELIYYFALGGAILLTAATCVLIRICLDHQLRYLPLFFSTATVAFVLLNRDSIDVFFMPIAARISLVNYLLFYVDYRPVCDRPSIHLVDCFAAFAGIALPLGCFSEPLVSLYKQDAMSSLEVAEEAIAHCVESTTLVLALKMAPTHAVRISLCISGAFLIVSICLLALTTGDAPLFYGILRLTWMATILIIYRG